jgi:glycosyltransferase involved in cell wall biosynthesis
LNIVEPNHPTEKRNAVNPRVSAVIIFFNGEDFLAEAIESVIAQTFGDLELLLADDGSGPAATAIAKDYAVRHPGRIRYLQHPDHINRGMSATRNLGVRHARGELIAFLDADDVWLPSKLAEHVALLDAHPELGLVCGATIYWRSWSNGQDDVVATGHRQNEVIYPPDAALALFPLGGAAPVSMSDIVLRREHIERVGGFEEAFTGHYESRAFLSKIFMSSPVYFDSRASNKYRQHPASCVATAFREGTHAKNRLIFLEWLEQYLSTVGSVDPRLTVSLRRALRPYRRPRLDYLFSVPSKARNRLRRLRGRVTQLLHLF